MIKIDKCLKSNCNFSNTQPAVTFRVENKYITYSNKKLFDLVLACANNLKFYKKVALIGSNKIEYLIVLFAVLGYVGDLFLIDKRLDNKEIDKMLSIYNPDCVVLDSDLDLNFNIKSIKFSDISLSLKDALLDIKPISDNFLYIHTSGTTGEQKIIKHNEKSLFAPLNYLHRFWKTSKKDSCYFVIPLYHIYGITTLLHCLYINVKIILEYDYNNMESSLKITKPTLFMGVPLIYKKIENKILENNKKMVSFLFKISKFLLKFRIDIRHILFKKVHDIFGNNYRFGCSAGAPLNNKTASFFYDLGLPIYDVYGLSETGPIAINFRKETFKNELMILPSNNVKIINSNNNNVGEICVKGNNVFSGYLNADNNVFTKDNFFKTGDIGKLNNNIISIISRKDKIRKVSNGEKIIIK